MKFKRSFNLPTADFKDSEMVELQVETVPDKIEDLQYGQDMIYKIKLPDYIFNELADSLPKYATKADINNRASISGCFVEIRNSPLTKKFQKTQSAYAIKDLEQYCSEISSELNEKYSTNILSKTKKIFIKYNHDFEGERSHYNHASFGMVVSNRFQYFIGYEIVHNPEVQKNRIYPIVKEYITDILDKGSNFSNVYREANLCLHPNKKYTDFEKEYSIVDWTEDREQFCINIQNAFLKINGELETFLNNLDNTKFDSLMTNNTLKLLQ